ncbi:MAG: peptidase [Bythopirellula sp.]
MHDSLTNNVSRRRFLRSAGCGTAAMLVAPAIVTAKKTDNRPILGEGDYRYEVFHDWPQLPDHLQWQTTQNVALDSEGLLYVMHQGLGDSSHRDTILIFDRQGKFVRSFGKEFHGGGHGIEIRNEDGQDFIYVAAYRKVRSIAKLDLRGELVWRRGAPMEAGIYEAGEDQIEHIDGGKSRNRFHPTNTAFHPDGGFFVADGYGAYSIHQFDSEGNWIQHFGGLGSNEGEFDLPHGLWVDDRDPQHPSLVISDRVNKRLQWFTLDGVHLRTQGGFLLPANNDVWGELMVVPDLVGRVTLLDRQNKVLAHLGDDSARVQADKKYTIRKDPSKWRSGKFIHPHDACFDDEGNIIVAEWVAAGRITKLRLLN